METAALATLMKNIGDMFEIDFAKGLGKDHWEDGLEFLDDITQWGCQYEESHLRYTPEVQYLGKIFLDLILLSYPAVMRPLGYHALLIFLGERMRHFFGLPEPGVAMSALVYGLLLCRKSFVRYLTLPRMRPFSVLTDPEPKTGRMQKTRYLREPWANGGMLPGDTGQSMKPGGFVFEDLGPLNQVGMGSKRMTQIEERVRMTALRENPFHA
ncbi:hypothetical protein CDD83_3227 [Cordyceps sp. RAO-2017]|nr:hypothetical protein CDD83_3227 [Cordyceps sp. RAO-2017]